MKEIEYSYLAGLIDGDGYISIKYRPSSSTYRYAIQVIMIMNDDIKDFLTRCEFSEINSCIPKLSKFAIEGLKAENICKELIKYSIAKKDQLEVFLKARSLMCDRGQRYTNETFRKIAQLHDELKSLHVRSKIGKWNEITIMEHRCSYLG